MLCGLAWHPNLAIKASGLLRISSDLGTAGSDISPERDDDASGESGTVTRALLTVIEAFGPSRVFWGSDFTVQPRSASYRRSSQIISRLPGLARDEVDLIMGGAIAAWLAAPG